VEVGRRPAALQIFREHTSGSETEPPGRLAGLNRPTPFVKGELGPQAQKLRAPEGDLSSIDQRHRKRHHGAGAAFKPIGAATAGAGEIPAGSDEPGVAELTAMNSQPAGAA